MSKTYYGKSAQNTKSARDSINQLKAFLHSIDRIPNEELQVAADNIKLQALAQVPLKTGRLQQSIEVWVTKGHRKKYITAKAEARNPVTNYNYAAMQHDRTDYHHSDGRKAYYIRDPFLNEIQAMHRRINERLQP